MAFEGYYKRYDKGKKNEDDDVEKEIKISMSRVFPFNFETEMESRKKLIKLCGRESA